MGVISPCAFPAWSSLSVFPQSPFVREDAQKPDP